MAVKPWGAVHVNRPVHQMARDADPRHANALPLYVGRVGWTWVSVGGGADARPPPPAPGRGRDVAQVEQ